MASTDAVRRLQRNHTQTLDPVGCCLALEGGLTSEEGLGEALRQRSEQGSSRLPSFPEEGLPGAPAGPDDAGGAPDGGGGGSSRSRGGSTGGGAALPADYASGLHSSSQRLLKTVGSGTSAGGGSDGGAVPLPEQETLRVGFPGQGHHHHHHHHHKGAVVPAAANAGVPGDVVPLAQPPPAAAPPAADGSGAALDLHSAPSTVLASCDDAPCPHSTSPSDPCTTCPPFAVKATCGKRLIMEDTYALVPNICELPMAPMSADFADKLPVRIASQLANGEPSGSPPGSGNVGDAGDSGTNDAAAAAPAAGPGTAAAPASEREGSGSSAGAGGFGAVVDGVTAVERLHFFGVYDGHGGIEASQHCAARLHHHLSAALREMAAAAALTPSAPCSGDGLLPVGPDGEADGTCRATSWRTHPPVLPDVRFVAVSRAVAAASAGGAASGSPGSPHGGGAAPVLPDDCGIAAAAAAAEAAAAVEGAPVGVTVAPEEVSPEDEDALSALSRECSNSDRERRAAQAVAAEADAQAVAQEAVAVAAAALAGASPPSGPAATSSSSGDEAGSADDGSECTTASMAALLEDALREAFLKTDEEFSGDGTAGLVGSTAVCALVGTHRVWIANCGDSRAVLCRGGQAVQVTDDHKPEREDEAERVEKAGGQVLYWNGHRVMGVLAMSRAIGDHCLRPYVIPEPEITVFKRHPSDEVLLLASDGLWDVMPNQEATDLAMRCIRRARDKGASPKAAARVAATILTKAAVDRGSRDNITVMVIDLSRGGGCQGGGGGSGGQDAAAAAAGPCCADAEPCARPQGGEEDGTRLQMERVGSGGGEAAAAGEEPGAVPLPEQQQQQQPRREGHGHKAGGGIAAAPAGDSEDPLLAGSGACSSPFAINMGAPAADGPLGSGGGADDGLSSCSCSAGGGLGGDSSSSLGSSNCSQLGALSPLMQRQQQEREVAPRVSGGPFAAAAAEGFGTEAPQPAPATEPVPLCAPTASVQRQPSSSPFSAFNMAPFDDDSGSTSDGDGAAIATT